MMKKLAEQVFVINTAGKIGDVNNYMIEQFVQKLL
jgi:hypothetical protein